MTAPADPPQLDIAARIVLMIRTMHTLVFTRRLGLTPELKMLICNRLCRIANRFEAAVARMRAGKKMRRSPSRERTGDGGGGQPGPEPPKPRTPPPRTALSQRDWLRRAVGVFFNSQAGCLRDLLENPELLALIAADVRIGRELRPLYRALGIDLLPEKPRRRRRRNQGPGEQPAEEPPARTLAARPWISKPAKPPKQPPPPPPAPYPPPPPDPYPRTPGDPKPSVLAIYGRGLVRG